MTAKVHVRNIFLCLVCFGFSLFSFAQKVEGYVYDKATNEALQGVTVYFDGSSVGTVTNAEGYFELHTASKISSTLVISYMGYSAVHISDPYQNKLFKIYMEETSIGLSEVVVRPDPFTREAKMEVFRKQFLGANYTGFCTIQNEDAITVTYNMNNSKLLAYAEAPLTIKNNFLGYVVTYNIVNFELEYTQNTLDENYLKSVFYAGTSFFNDVSEGKKKYVRRRKETYYGSSMHFLRTVAKQDYQEEKFRIFKGSFEVNPLENFTVTDTAGYKKFTAVQPKWNILYRKREQSALELKEPIYIDAYGNFSPITGLFFGGYMGAQRFKEVLPLDYYPPE